MPYSSFTIAQVKRQFELNDVTEYSLDPIDRILGILKWMVDGSV